MTEFAERAELPEMEIAQAEVYLVRVRAGARSKPSAKTFDQLRLEAHTSVSDPRDVVEGVIRRSGHGHHLRCCVSSIATLSKQ